MPLPVHLSKKVLQWVQTQVQGKQLPRSVQANLDAWLRGTKEPVFYQVEEAARATGIPLGYFFLQTPPREDGIWTEFRIRDWAKHTRPSRELTDTVHSMRMVQDWMRNQLLAEGAAPLPFLGSLREETNAAGVASAVRKLLRLETDWVRTLGVQKALVPFLCSRLSEMGAAVMRSGSAEGSPRRPLDVQEFRGFALLDEVAPLIFLNTRDSPGGMVLSLLQAYVYLCRGKACLLGWEPQGQDKGKDKEDALCRTAAAEVFLPESLFRDAWAQAATGRDNAAATRLLGRRLHCGTAAAAERAADLQLLDRDEYSRIRSDGNQKNRESSRTGQTQLDPRFLRMLRASADAGETTYTEAYRLTNSNRGTFDSLT